MKDPSFQVLEKALGVVGDPLVDIFGGGSL